MKCPNCKQESAIKHPTLGWINGKNCKNTRRIPTSIEFTSDEIKWQRKEYRDDILQPFHQGELSKEYVEKHGTKGIQVTEEEVKSAKYVWNELGYYNEEN